MILRCAAGTVTAVIAILLQCIEPGRAGSAPVPINHTLFTQILADHVHEGLVDYRALKMDPRFPRYLAQLQEVNPDTLAGNDKLAFWLNAYNAFTIQYVLDRYPIKSLMNKLAYVTGGSAFQTRFITIHHTKYSLDDIEHGILRPLGDPRIHFALVCGAKSCPPLRQEAYASARLSEQLDDQGRIFLGQATKNRFDLDKNEVHISRIFDWFKGDFRRNGKSELDFISTFLPPELARMLRENAGKIKIEYTAYDWSLNEL